MKARDDFKEEFQNNQYNHGSGRGDGVAERDKVRPVWSSKQKYIFNKILVMASLASRECFGL